MPVAVVELFVGSRGVCRGGGLWGVRTPLSSHS